MKHDRERKKYLSNLREKINFPVGCIYTDEEIQGMKEYPCWTCDRGPKACCIDEFQKADGVYIETKRAGPEYYGDR